MTVQTTSSVLLQAAWQIENDNRPDNVVAPPLNGLFLNPLSPTIHIQILQTGLYTFP